MKTDLFHSCGHCWVFQICWHIECSTFTASSFRIWNSSTGILSPPLALFIVMLSKAHLTSHSRMYGSWWVITPSWLSGLWRSFLCSSSVYSHLFLISSASVWKFFVEIKERTALFISKFKACRKSKSVFFKGKGEQQEDWLMGEGFLRIKGQPEIPLAFPPSFSPWVRAHSLSCVLLFGPHGRSPAGSSVYGILQARILEWVTISSCRGSSRPRDRTHVSCGSCVTGGLFTLEPPGKPLLHPSFRQFLPPVSSLPLLWPTIAICPEPLKQGIFTSLL